MPNEFAILNEDEFDRDYGPTLNDSPLDLTRENLEAMDIRHVWTQAEDDAAGGWLLNGIFTTRFEDFVAGRAAFNVMGYWLTPKPWPGEPGAIRVKWTDPEEED
jgi:hypothetical protein